MPLRYKIDVLNALKEAGYSSYRLRKERLFGERVIQQLRVGDPVSWEVLSRLCDLLQCDVGDILCADRQATPPAGDSAAGQGGR